MNPQNVLGVHVAHHGELDEVIGIAVDVCADIEQKRRDTVDGGKNLGERGAVDAGEHAENHLCGGHGGAGVSCGEEASGAAFADHFEADAHGGVALGADGLGGLVVHGDPLAGGGDEDGQTLPAQGMAQDGTQLVFGTDEVDADVELAGSKDSPANLWLGGFVGTHCVYNDVSRHQQGTVGAEM